EVGSSMIQQRERLLDLSEEMIQLLIEEQCPPNSHAEDWDLEAIRAAVKQRFNFEPALDEHGGLDRETLAESLWGEVEKVIEARETEYPLPVILHYARLFYLEEIDERWIEHLKAMEALREGIHLRGYGQMDPKQEYKKAGFTIFGEMMNNIGRNVCEKLFHMQLQRADAPAAPQPVPAAAQSKPRKTIESGGGAEAQQAQATNGGNGAGEAKPVRRNAPKVGRNDPCPCGSGKKYKKCHGAGEVTT
ncbi:MAG TPA: SEC-C metal-binding domain-containing protein, partial [Polyangia bacterium]|nr:SEC-C metal-binding domain-containing protein [Polyangia bacterium]